jgi:hypothetical protein
MSKLKLLLGLGLLLFVFVGTDNITSYVNKVLGAVTQVAEKPNLGLEKPEQALIDETKPLAEAVTDKEDKVKLAIFNLEFSKRLPKYLEKSVSVQQLLNVYKEAGVKVFADTMKFKYPMYGDGLKNMIFKVVGEDEHILSEDEQKLLKKKFEALSWSLCQ